MDKFRRMFGEELHDFKQLKNEIKAELSSLRKKRQEATRKKSDKASVRDLYRAKELQASSHTDSDGNHRPVKAPERLTADRVRTAPLDHTWIPEVLNTDDEEEAQQPKKRLKKKHAATQ